MDQQIKQRLVGTAVICALAVIFLPMLLDGDDIDRVPLTVSIPEPPLVVVEPEFDQKIAELQANSEQLPDLEARFVDEQSMDSADEQAIASKGAPSQKSEKIPDQPVSQVDDDNKVHVGGDTWVLQVGSFKDREKALSQRDKLRQSNIAAVFVEQFSTDGQMSYRVRLGPFLSYAQSEVARNKVAAKYHYEGLIMVYER